MYEFWVEQCVCVYIYTHTHIYVYTHVVDGQKWHHIFNSLITKITPQLALSGTQYSSKLNNAKSNNKIRRSM